MADTDSNSIGTETKFATYFGMEFTYSDMEIIRVDDTNSCVVYSDITIIKSNNSKYRIGNKFDQLSVELTLHFENDDGTPNVGKMMT